MWSITILTQYFSLFILFYFLFYIVCLHSSEYVFLYTVSSGTLNSTIHWFPALISIAII